MPRLPLEPPTDETAPFTEPARAFPPTPGIHSA